MAGSYPELEASIGFYPTSDLTTTQNFYGHVLGLPLARDQGNCLIFQIAETSYVGFCHHDHPFHSHPGLILTLVTDDVDGIYQRLLDHEVPVEGAPKTDETYRIYHFFTRDPNGHRVEVQRFLDPL